MSRVGFALFGLGNMGKYSKKVFGLKSMGKQDCAQNMIN